MDERTSEYFRDIADQRNERTHEILKVGGPCKCAECMAKRMKEIQERVIGTGASNWHPELSSNPDMWDYAKRRRTN